MAIAAFRPVEPPRLVEVRENGRPIALRSVDRVANDLAHHPALPVTAFPEFEGFDAEVTYVNLTGGAALTGWVMGYESGHQGAERWAASIACCATTIEEPPTGSVSLSTDDVEVRRFVAGPPGAPQTVYDAQSGTTELLLVFTGAPPPDQAVVGVIERLFADP